MWSHHGTTKWIACQSHTPPFDRRKLRWTRIASFKTYQRLHHLRAVRVNVFVRVNAWICNEMSKRKIVRSHWQLFFNANFFGVCVWLNATAIQWLLLKYYRRPVKAASPTQKTARHTVRHTTRSDDRTDGAHVHACKMQFSVSGGRANPV